VSTLLLGRDLTIDTAPAGPATLPPPPLGLVPVAHARMAVILALFVLAVTAVIVRLTWLAVMPDTEMTASRYGVPSARGDIVDRNGVPLAQTILVPSIGVQPDKVIGDKRDLARRLAELMPEETEAWYYARLTSTAPFQYLKRHARPELAVAVNALGDPGIRIGREPERLYTQSATAAHVLGFTNAQGRGAMGMEKFLDGRLTDAAMQGRPASLSIDLRVQSALESELGHAMVKHQALGAAGLILDVDTGEVMAMVSLPSFNPNHVRSLEGQFNNVTKGVYELGSTFKPITIAGAIEAGVVTSMQRRYDAVEPLAVGRFRIKDDHAQRRFLNVPETLVHSSNIVTARLADEMGEDRMKALFRSLGFHQPLDIEIERSSPRFSDARWSRARVMTSGYGHGVAVTPMHLAIAYAALVNGGILRPATMMKLAPSQVPEGTRVFSESTSQRMRQLLRLIAVRGTGKRGDAAGYRVGAKTGTAERLSATGGYSKTVNVSTFAAAFPMDAPRYVVVAMLDSPKASADTFGQTAAAWTVAPAVSRTIQRTGPMLGVLPDPSRDIDLSELEPLLWSPPGAQVAGE
jgi:cell division protein FtsI (penicillin-binding protein 3)